MTYEVVWSNCIAPCPDVHVAWLVGTAGVAWARGGRRNGRRETADAGWAGGVWATGEFNVNVFFDNCRKFLLRSVAPSHSKELYHNSNHPHVLHAQGNITDHAQSGHFSCHSQCKRTPDGSSHPGCHTYAHEQCKPAWLAERGPHVLTTLLPSGQDGDDGRGDGGGKGGGKSGAGDGGGEGGGGEMRSSGTCDVTQL